MTTLTSSRPWTAQAACAGLSGRDRDFWSPPDDLDDLERGFQFHLARRICATCPVRTACVLDALQGLPLADEESMRGGLTPDELRELARDLTMPERRRAQCGTRSKYVAGCRCERCRAAHRTYERERRLWRRSVAEEPVKVLTPRAAVATRLSAREPRTPRQIARRAGLKTRVVRRVLAVMVADGAAAVAGESPAGPPLYVRPVRATTRRTA